MIRLLPSWAINAGCVNSSPESTIPIRMPLPRKTLSCSSYIGKHAAIRFSACTACSYSICRVRSMYKTSGIYVRRRISSLEAVPTAKWFNNGTIGKTAISCKESNAPRYRIKMVNCRVELWSVSKDTASPVLIFSVE